MNSVYKREYIIQGSEVDFQQKLRLSTLFLDLQDLATEHAEQLEAGRDHLGRFNGIWVLARVKLDIVRLPTWKERIVIETWPQQPGRVDFERDFLVYDSEGNVIIRAVSVWVIIDINTRRIKRSSQVDITFPHVDRDRAIDSNIGKLRLKEESLKHLYERRVAYSDIDVNEHLNNSRYIDYIMDCFPLEVHRNNSLTSIQVDYINEALPGDNIVMYLCDGNSVDCSREQGTADPESNAVYIVGCNQETGKTVFRAEVKMKEKVV